jgi:uncharacterized protein involved in tolerance to divalent cations
MDNVPMYYMDEDIFSDKEWKHILKATEQDLDNQIAQDIEDQD